jgi:carboxypeptidase family protein/TonB-dependent receptor-like protein
VRNFSSSRSVLHVALLLGAVALLAQLPSLLVAQNMASATSISGIVTDPQGSRVANASLTLSNQERAITRIFKTDATGTFSFSLLPAATYSLKIDATGFAELQQNGIVLAVGQSVELNPSLSLATASEKVVVSSEAPLLTTDTPDIGDEVSGKQMLEMPLNFRSSLALIFLDSQNRWFDQGALGNSVDTADQDYSLMAVGGQLFGANSFLLDGSWNGMMAYNGVMYVPSIDTVQEFKMSTNTFSAQYAMSEGNAISVVTKGGTEQFHGDTYEFLRNYALDSNLIFNKIAGAPRTATRMNQFGATEGGPLYIPGLMHRTHKMFFFGGYEGLRLGAVSQLTSTVPDSGMVAGNLSEFLGAQLPGASGTDALCRPVYQGQIYNPFSTRSVVSTCSTANSTAGQTVEIRDPVPGNNIAAVAGLEDAAAKKIVTYFPSPSNSNSPVQGNNFFADASVPTTSNEMSVRIDQNLTENSRFYARYSRKWEAKVQSAPLFGASNPAGPGQTNPNNRYNVASGYSQVLSPTLTLSLNFGYNRFVEGNVGQGSGFQLQTLGLPASLTTASPFFPIVNVSGFAELGNATTEATALDEGTISADVVKVKGNHTFSFGYMGILSMVLGGAPIHTTFNFTSAFSAGPNPSNPTSGTGNAFASFLMGSVGANSSTGVAQYPALSKHYFGWYLQDDWKATKNLTLNLGVRYDIQLAPTERHNRQAYFVPNQVNPISSFASGGPYYGQLVYNTPGNRYFYQNSYTNFSPRLGFSYMATKKLAARGGFALFFPDEWAGDPTMPGYAQTTTLVSSLNGGLNPSSTLSNPFPQGILPIIGNTQGGLTDVGQTLSTSVFKRPSSYVEQWMFGLEYSLTPRDVIEADYVGSHALKFVISGLNLNQLPPGDLALGSSALTAAVPNPFFGLGPVAGSGCGLAGATVPAYQLMLPMPEFCDSVTNAKDNTAFAFYDALDVKYQHRLSNDLTIMGTYTHAKALDDTIGGSTFYAFYGETVRNNYNLAQEKSVAYADTPNAAVVSYIYSLPVGRGKLIGSNWGKKTDAAFGGWQVAGDTTFDEGEPMGISANLNPGSVYGGGQHALVVGNPTVPGPVAANPSCSAPTKLRNITHWYNPCAFEAAPAGTFGNAPRYFSNLRRPPYYDSDISLSKWTNLSDSLRMQFRAEFFNAFNHVNLGPPTNTTPGTGSAGSIVYADIARQIQFAAKFYW